MKSLVGSRVLSRVITYTHWLSNKLKLDVPMILPYSQDGEYIFKTDNIDWLGEPRFLNYLGEVRDNYVFVATDDPEIVGYYHAGEFLESVVYMHADTLVRMMIESEEPIHIFACLKTDDTPINFAADVRHKHIMDQLSTPRGGEDSDQDFEQEVCELLEIYGEITDVSRPDDRTLWFRFEGDFFELTY